MERSGAETDSLPHPLRQRVSRKGWGKESDLVSFECEVSVSRVQMLTLPLSPPVVFFFTCHLFVARVTS
jgi:hypothetical protein